MIYIRYMDRYWSVSKDNYEAWLLENTKVLTGLDGRFKMLKRKPINVYPRDFTGHDEDGFKFEVEQYFSCPKYING